MSPTRRSAWGSRSRASAIKQTLTTLIRRLEHAGLVERRDDPRDGRAAFIFLTERSRSLEPVAEATLQMLDVLVRKPLGVDQLATLEDALRQVTELAHAADS